MSKKLELDLNCPCCQTTIKAALYRSIWVETPEHMDLIKDNQISVMHYPACGFSEMPPIPFLATNVKKSAWGFKAFLGTLPLDLFVRQ